MEENIRRLHDIVERSFAKLPSLRQAVEDTVVGCRFQAQRLQIIRLQLELVLADSPRERGYRLRIFQSKHHQVARCVLRENRVGVVLCGGRYVQIAAGD